MTITNGYTSLAEFNNFSRLTTPADAPIVETCILAASRQIDRYCGRRFWQDSAVVAREYHADDADCVETDDISTTTGLIVKIDTNLDSTYATTLTITTDFLLYPLNAGDEVPARPYNEIRIAYGSSQAFPTSGRPGVQVTAKFGWPAIPDEVVLACILQAQMLYSSKDARAGILQFGGDGFASRLSRYMHPQAELLLEPYVKVVR